jgi:hypothetical protein
VQSYSACTIHIDGLQADRTNAGDANAALNLSEDALSEGEHTVRLVAKSDDETTIYKSAQYEIEL